MKNHLIATLAIILSVVLSSCGGIKGIEYTNYSQRKFKSAKESNNFLLKHGSSSYSKEVGNLKYDVKHTIARFPYLIDATIVNSYLDKLIGHGKKSIIVNSANGSRVVKKSKFNRVKISQNWDKHEMEIKDYSNGNHLLISVKNNTNPIIKINKGFSREKNFITKNMKDVYGFKSTYKNSEYTELMLETTLEWVLIEDVIKILKLYPNTKTKEILVDKYISLAYTQGDVSKIIANIPDISLSNTTELKIKYYELSENVVDLKRAKNLYPKIEAIQIFDICPYIDKFILTSSKKELDYLKTEYGNSNCKNKIDNAIITTCPDIDCCFEVAKQYPELETTLAFRAANLIKSLEDCYKVNMEYPFLNDTIGSIAINYANSFDACIDICNTFKKNRSNILMGQKILSFAENIEQNTLVASIFKNVSVISNAAKRNSSLLTEITAKKEYKRLLYAFDKNYLLPKIAIDRINYFIEKYPMSKSNIVALTEWKNKYSELVVIDSNAMLSKERIVNSDYEWNKADYLNIENWMLYYASYNSDIEKEYNKIIPRIIEKRLDGNNDINFIINRLSDFCTDSLITICEKAKYKLKKELVSSILKVNVGTYRKSHTIHRDSEKVKSYYNVGDKVYETETEVGGNYNRIDGIHIYGEITNLTKYKIEVYVDIDMNYRRPKLFGNIYSTEDAGKSFIIKPFETRQIEYDAPLSEGKGYFTGSKYKGFSLNSVNGLNL